VRVAEETRSKIAHWREHAPRLAEEVAEDWGLVLAASYPPGACGHVLRAELPDGSPAVLKVSWPDRESLQEPDALERWGGDGAVRLLARDDERCAILVERCDPGAELGSLETEAALDVVVELLPRLWKDASGFRPVEDEAPFLADDIERARDPRLRDAARAYLRDLVPSQGERVLVDVDLHGANILAAEREPWLAIDPKPLAAERELAAAPLVRSPELGFSKRAVHYRLDRLCTDLSLDRQRVLGWTVAHTVAWSGAFDDEHPHLQAVRWLLECA
jgi:streptomycin 6-kinase